MHLRSSAHHCECGLLIPPDRRRPTSSDRNGCPRCDALDTPSKNTAAPVRQPQKWDYANSLIVTRACNAFLLSRGPPLRSPYKFNPSHPDEES